MSAKPVAWQVDFRSGRVSICTSETDMLEVKHEIDGGHLRATLTPLYASSPAQARALAIAEAARVCKQEAATFTIHNCTFPESYKRGAQLCADRVSALSPAPSVAEEWIDTILTNLHDEHDFSRESAVRATLAALGVEVTK